MKPSALAPDNFFVVRTPLLPADEAYAWSDDLEATTAPDDLGALDRDRAMLRDRLRAVCLRPEVQEALYLATPKLAKHCRAYLAGAPDPKVERSLIRYFVRMCTRSTPFGTFAGSGTGTIAGRTRLRVGPSEENDRRTRLDHLYLTQLALALEERFKRKLTYRVNSSLYKAGDQIRYAEASVRGERSYRLVALAPSEGVVETIAHARDGASFDELAAALVDEDTSFEDAADFIDALIDSQVLESDLMPPVTGPEAMSWMVARLRGLEGAEQEAQILDDVCSTLEKVDAGGIGADTATYADIAGSLERLPAPVERSRLFQTDMVTSFSEAELGPRVVAEIERATDALRRFMGTPSGTPLEKWRREFVDRYDTREVPLTEAIDEESGIGFLPSRGPASDAAPLLEGLVWPTASDETGATLGPKAQHLMGRLLETLRAGKDELILDDHDLEAIGADEPPPLPDAFAALVSVAASSQEALDEGDFQLLLHGAVGPSGARLLGRFCHVDERLRDAVAGHMRAEESLRPETVFAEIVHLPEGRSGNILARPLLRDHEIPFLGRSGAATGNQIPVSDLMISVQGDRVVLRSATLDREVAPRLTSAQNYTARSLGVFRFLCALQGQGCTEGVVWNWGAFEAATFLPRVVFGRTVLSRAQWTFKEGAVAALTTARDDNEAFTRMQDLRLSAGLPRFVVLADEDNELFIDLDNALAVGMLVGMVGKRSHFRLVESWPDRDELLVEGPAGRHANELVVPFLRVESSIKPTPPQLSWHDRERSFAPGSKWLYLKLFTGVASADAVLRDIVAPITGETVASGAADSWFFIRYSDPEWHLRVRIHGDPQALLDRVIPSLHRASGSHSGLRRIQIDTYEREIKRYGGPAAIESVEKMFWIDSEATLAIVTGAGGDTGMDARWRLALVGVDLIFDDLGLSHNAKREVARRMRNAYAHEFSADALLKKQIGQRYRSERKQLEALLARSDDRDPTLDGGLILLDERSKRLEPHAAYLCRLAEKGSLTTELEDIATGLAHLHVNRLIRAAQRAHEMVIYDFLDRWYTTLTSRKVAGPAVGIRPPRPRV